MAIQDRRDDELLAAIAARDDDPTAAVEAWTSFRDRHVRRVYSWVYRSPAAAEFVDCVFDKVWDCAGSFVPRDATRGDDREIRRVVLGWLRTITRNAACDHYRKHKGHYREDLAKEQLIAIPASTPAHEQQNTRERLLLIKEAITKLNPRDQELAMISGNWFDVERGTTDIPEEVISRLAKDYGVKSATLRKRRERVFQKIRKYVEDKEARERS